MADLNDFLINDLQQSYEQMRHYDNLSDSTVKFVISIFGALLAAIITILAEKLDHGNDYILCILVFGMIVSVIFLLLVTRNRVYFTIHSRQTYSIRNYFLSISEKEKNFSFENILYRNPTFPKFYHNQSKYTIHYILISLACSIFFGAFMFIILNKWFYLYASILFSSFAAIVLIFTLHKLVHYYLMKKEKKYSAEEIIHELDKDTSK